MVHQDEISVGTRGNGDMHDLTERVHHMVRKSSVTTGLVNVCVVGSTAAVGTIEYEPGLKEDLPAVLNRLIPASRSYGHEKAWHDGNGHSHLQSTVVGPEVTLPVRGGSLAVGTWQQVVLLECDVRARQRTIVVTVLGE